jgi:hypothetical protein
MDENTKTQNETDEKEEPTEDLTAPMEVDLEYMECPVKIKNPTTGTVEEYVLRECDGFNRNSYIHFIQNNVRTENGQPVGMKDYTTVESELLKRCLFKKGEAKPVELKFINALPGRTSEKLYDRAAKLCNLDQKAKKAKAQAKKD